MLTMFRRLAAIAVLCLLACPALADSTRTPLDPAAWADIAAVGSAVEVQNVSSTPVYLTTSATTPASSSAATVLVPNERICRVVSAGDLWARGPGSVVVTGGLTCVGSGGGGGGGGSVTQGTSPWVDNISQIGGAALALGQTTMSASLPVVIASNQGAVPVSNASLPLPAGAATAANQNVTAAGTSATNAQAIQGVTGGVPQNVANAGTFAVQNTAALPAGTNQIGVLDDSVVPSGFPASASSAAVIGNVIDTTGYQTVSVALTGTFVATVVWQESNDQTNWTSTAGLSDFNTGTVLDATNTSVTGAYQIPVRARYLRINVTSYTSGTVTATVYLRSAPPTVRSVYVAAPVAVSTTNASGGVTSASRIPSSAASTNLTNAKASAGRLYKIYACNTVASARFVKFYNVVSATVGTTTVAVSRELPPSQCASYDWADVGFYFSTAISYAITTGTADSDTTAVAAGDIVQFSAEYQ